MQYFQLNTVQNSIQEFAKYILDNKYPCIKQFVFKTIYFLFTVDINGRSTLDNNNKNISQEIARMFKFVRDLV